MGCAGTLEKQERMARHLTFQNLALLSQEEFCLISSAFFLLAPKYYLISFPSGSDLERNVTRSQLPIIVIIFGK